MKKRILAMLLAAALMLGMLPTVAFAEESSAPVYLAAFAPDISVDGNLTEAG